MRCDRHSSPTTTMLAVRARVSTKWGISTFVLEVNNPRQNENARSHQEGRLLDAAMLFLKTCCLPLPLAHDKHKARDGPRQGYTGNMRNGRVTHRYFPTHVAWRMGRSTVVTWGGSACCFAFFSEFTTTTRGGISTGRKTKKKKNGKQRDAKRKRGRYIIARPMQVATMRMSDSPPHQKRTLHTTGVFHRFTPTRRSFVPSFGANRVVDSARSRLG
mgnify:FL=1